MTSNKFLNNSKFKVTIPSPSPTLYVTVARYWSPETSAQPVEHRDCQLTLSTSFHQGAVPIQTNRIAALVSLSKPLTSRPRFSPSSRSSFAAQVGGEWFSLSMRWLASKKPESSGRWHVSTVTYRPVLVPVKLKNRKPFVVIRNNQKRDKVRVRMVSNGGPKFHWAWKSVRMARVDHGILSWDLSPRRRTGEGWTIGNDSISRTLDFVNSDFYLCLFDKRWNRRHLWTDYTCCFFEIINLDLGDWGETFWREVEA